MLGVAGVNIGGKNINDLRNADEMAFIADSEEKLQEMGSLSVRESDSKGIQVNVSKTQVWVVSKGKTQVPANIVIND